MRTWAEINLDNLAYNIRKIKKIALNKKIMGILKADAYGHGAVMIAKELEKMKIESFAVATLEEAIELRESGIKGSILILGCSPVDTWENIINYKLSMTVASFEEIEKLKSLSLKAKVHLAIDTGMGRIGFNLEEGLKAIEYINENKIAEVEGVYSHLSSADLDEEKDYTREQIKRFKPYEKLNLKYIHILNSAGSFLFLEDTISNYIRPGIALYGIMPYFSKDNFLKPVLKLKSKLIFIKKIKEDSYISYQKKYLAKKGEIIGTVAIGYGDGLNRAFSNKGKVLIKGKLCKIVGNICMDQLMVSIPKEVGDIELETEVTIYPDDYNKIASEINTISYELLTNINRRVERIYIKNNKIVGRRSMLKIEDWKNFKFKKESNDNFI